MPSPFALIKSVPPEILIEPVLEENLSPGLPGLEVDEPLESTPPAALRPSSLATKLTFPLVITIFVASSPS